MDNRNYRRKIHINKISLVIEIVLTLCMAITVATIGLSNLSNEAGRFSKDLEKDYDVVFDNYITTFNLLTGQIREKLEEDPSFDEMNEWLQSKEDEFAEQVGVEIYDGVALTYKGGFAHSWHYGEYSNYDPNTRPWYQQAQEAKGEVAIVAPYVTYLDASYFEDGGNVLMSIVQKYNDEISFDYDIKLTEIRDILSSRGFQYKTSKVMLYDKAGYILSSNDENQYAHNIKKADKTISQDLSDKVMESANRPNHLGVFSVDGQLKIMYSSKDDNGNTTCILYPFWEVMFRNFLVTGLVVLMFIIFEIMMYYRNKKTILEFELRDNRLSHVLDESYDAQILVDVDNMKFYGNEKAERLAEDGSYETLYPRLCMMMLDDDSKKKLDEFISPDILGSPESEREKLVTEKFNVKRYDLDQEDNAFVYEVSRIIMQNNGKTLVSIMADDITEDATILKDALAKAEEASNAKGTFLARMSHEIRTPMNAIIGETTLAMKNIDKTGKVKECLDKVMISSKHLLELINDILDMSSIESNKMKIAHEDFDIKEVVETITTLYYSQCNAKGITFRAKLTHVTTEVLVGDQLRLQQIILNLLSNAVKFTKSGGKIIFALEEERVSDGKLILHVKVKDTGRGMSKEYMDRIFKPFEQETALTAKEHGGSGLGLSITKNLVDLMGGKITVDSEEGVGTTFMVDIPYTAAANQVKVNNSEISSMRAIVVDDDVDTLDYISTMLNHIGIANDRAESGEEALGIITKARNDEKQYDVCIVDWKMPGMSGLELAEKIRAACGDDPIVIIASAYDLSEISEDSKDAGVDACITKPLFQSSLFDILMCISQGKLVNRTAQPTEYDFAGKRLLLVDDTDLNREIAQELLEMVNFQVDTAEDGKESVEIFEKSEPGTYQAILMDVQMPIMNGYEATQAIRQLNHPEAKSIPIIAMTANAFATDIAKSLEAGMNDHISKPIDTELMYEILSKYID